MLDVIGLSSGFFCFKRATNERLIDSCKRVQETIEFGLDFVLFIFFRKERDHRLCLAGPLWPDTKPYSRAYSCLQLLHQQSRGQPIPAPKYKEAPVLLQGFVVLLLLAVEVLQSFALEDYDLMQAESNASKRK
jgi:hypothetical protein